MSIDLEPKEGREDVAVYLRGVLAKNAPEVGRKVAGPVRAATLDRGILLVRSRAESPLDSIWLSVRLCGVRFFSVMICR